MTFTAKIIDLLPLIKRHTVNDVVTPTGTRSHTPTNFLECPQTRDPYAEGWDAAQAGYRESSNPYSGKPLLYGLWREGFWNYHFCGSK